MVTQREVMMLRKKLEDERMGKLYEEIETSNNPQAILRQQKTRRIIRNVVGGSKITGRGLLRIGKGTLNFIDSIATVPEAKRRVEARKRVKKRRSRR